MGSAAGRRTVVLRVETPLVRADIDGLCRRARALLEHAGTDLLVCDVHATEAAECTDMVVVDALTRLQLTAGRIGVRFCVHNASCELRELLTVSGLSEVVRTCADLGVEPLGKPEQGEQRGGVQERVDPGDPAAGDLDHLQ